MKEDPCRKSNIEVLLAVDKGISQNMAFMILPRQCFSKLQSQLIEKKIIPNHIRIVVARLLSKWLKLLATQVLAKSFWQCTHYRK